MRAQLAILISAAVLAACGSEGIDLDNPGGLLAGAAASGAPGTGAESVRCNLTADGICDQITGTLSATDKTTLQDSCAALGGSYAVGKCAAGTVSGHCSYSGDPKYYGVSGTWESHYSSPQTTTTAQGDCSSIVGTWVP